MKKLNYILLLSSALLATACLNNDFLERKPMDKVDETTIFIDNSTFGVYALGLYEMFPAYSNLKNVYDQGYQADDLFQSVPGSEDPWAWNKIKIPATDGGWKTAYKYIRDVNIMLDQVDNKSNKLTQEERDHWRSVGYFFRSYQYFELIKKFGNAVWVDHVLAYEDEESLCKPMDGRDVIVQHMMDDLHFAEEHLLSEDKNEIDLEVVRAFLSRVTLFEGTWRKYHGLSDAGKYLEECVRVSALLANDPAVNGMIENYDLIFTSPQLKGQPGILLYREYAPDLSWNNVVRPHKSNESKYEMTKDAVDSYLCTDGRPIYMQAGYPEIEQDPYTEFQNRDKRLLYTVIPPFKVVTPPENGAFSHEWSVHPNPLYSSYFPVMEKISGQGHKVFPLKQNGGSVLKYSPHFTTHNGGFGFMACQGGYYIYKYYEDFETYPVSGGASDCPIFRIGEVLLNYAEAAYELGSFDQNIADLTINRLRERGGVAHLDVADVIDDPRRDPEVEPLLWEIRRERRVELMGEPFRFDDIRRWKKGEYLNKQKFGRWYSVDQLVADKVLPQGKPCKMKFTASMKKGEVDPTATAGYIVFYNDPVASGYGWKDHFYYYPLPLDDIALSKGNLEQTPGWNN